MGVVVAAAAATVVVVVAVVVIVVVVIVVVVVVAVVVVLLCLSVFWLAGRLLNAHWGLFGGAGVLLVCCRQRMNS